MQNDETITGMIARLAEDAQRISTELARIARLHATQSRESTKATTERGAPPSAKDTRDAAYRAALNAFASALQAANSTEGPLDPQFVRDVLVKFRQERWRQFQNQKVSTNSPVEQAALGVLEVNPHVPNTAAVAMICGLPYDLILSVKEAQALAGNVDEKTVKRWFRLYEIGQRSPAGHRRISKSSLEKFLNVKKRDRVKMARQNVENA